MRLKKNKPPEISDSCPEKLSAVHSRSISNKKEQLSDCSLFDFFIFISFYFPRTDSTASRQRATALSRSFRSIFRGGLK